MMVGFVVVSYDKHLHIEDVQNCAAYYALGRIIPYLSEHEDATAYERALWELPEDMEAMNDLFRYSGYVLTLGVIQEFRGRGIAASLIKAVQLETWRRGKAMLLLNVATYNSPAIRMYKHLGFQSVAKLSDFYFLSEKPYSAYLEVWRVAYAHQALEAGIQSLMEYAFEKVGKPKFFLDQEIRNTFYGR